MHVIKENITELSPRVPMYYVQCMKLVVYRKGYLSSLENKKMKTLLGLSRERYTYLFYICIDEVQCKLKILCRLSA